VTGFPDGRSGRSLLISFVVTARFLFAKMFASLFFIKVNCTFDLNVRNLGIIFFSLLWYY